MKRIIVLSLIIACFSFASENPFSLGLSLHSGGQYFQTNEQCVLNSSDLIADGDVAVFKPTLCIGIEPRYRNTGLYINVQKPIVSYSLRRYYILSGGLIQRIIINEKSALNINLGTTWHSVNAAIHSNCMFIIYTHIKSKPGIDLGFGYSYLISDKLSLLLGFNYNFNVHYNDIPEPVTINDKYTQIISLNLGLMYSLF